MLKRFIIAGFLLMLLLFGLAFSYLHQYMNKPLLITDAVIEYVVPRGSSLNKVAHELHRQGVLASPELLRVYSRLYRQGGDIKAGDYLLEPGLTPKTLLAKLVAGDVRYYTLTLVEGWNLRQVLLALRQHDKLKQTIPLSTVTITPQLIDRGKNFSSLEGLLFPDTYRFQKGVTDIELLQQSYDRMQAVLLQEWELRVDGLPYKTPYDALIMASLVEKETGAASERPIIAGVFVRRLQKKMRLQTDPTIIYGLGAEFDGNLRSHHLKDKSNLYNTYRHGGLTPTPIALAGREAIHAALNPAAGSELYFVAKGDGSHYFSDTLEQHQAAVRKYQIYQRSKNYSSAPK